VPVSRKKVAILAVLGSVVPVAALIISPVVVTSARYASGLLSFGSAVALVPLRTDDRSSTEGITMQVPLPFPCHCNPTYASNFRLAFIWTIATFSYLVLQCVHHSPWWQRYIVIALLLGAHFLVAIAQTSDHPIEAITSWLPILIPTSAWVVSRVIIFQRRRYGSVEEGYELQVLGVN
jgi:hypothetical protein